ncbi:hypothetical protein [Rubellimicrobium rubrum]|uniref:hypothetical protein n=1 Tax=Rubellimicrobium rubrum TaxID=2585369 RepID=UPI00159BB9EE|nr:hypothetical protein [Rubellimicrobium rubrum]
MAVAAFRVLGPARGLVVTLVAAHLLLPTGLARFELPVLPSMDKYTIPSFAALGIAILFYRPLLRLWPQSWFARLFIILYVIGPLFTTLGNLDPITWGPLWLPGMQLKEVPALMLRQIATLAPFILGRSLLAGEDGLRLLTWTLVLSALAYSLPMLLEVRLSPQLNTWIYGYFQHDFIQMMRGDGFRPIVFLDHGLWAALLVSTAIMAVCILLRSGGAEAPVLRIALMLFWLLAVLIACKSLASIIYVLLICPIILFASFRMQVRIAALLGIMAFSYPLARGLGFVPTTTMVRLAEDISNPTRAQSLEYRFNNEEVLVERASERPLFGWGIWGRNHVHDPVSGRIMTVTDGRWIVTMGGFGWVGFIAEFGLMLIPLLNLWSRRSAQTSLAAGQALILAVIMVDQIPNASFTPITFLYAGALLGWAERPEAKTAKNRTVNRTPTIPVLLGGHGGPARPPSII